MISIEYGTKFKIADIDTELTVVYLEVEPNPNNSSEKRLIIHAYDEDVLESRLHPVDKSHQREW